MKKQIINGVAPHRCKYEKKYSKVIHVKNTASKWSAVTVLTKSKFAQNRYIPTVTSTLQVAQPKFNKVGILLT